MNAKVVGSRMKRLVLIAFAVLLPTGAFAGVPQDGPPDIDFQFKVDQAIKKGIAYLKGKSLNSRHGNADVLILLTYLHSACVPDNDPHLQKMLKAALEEKLEATYIVALTAMSLEEHNRVKHQTRIFQCAQFLADNISPAGETRYGKPTKYPKMPDPVPTAAPKVKTSGGSGLGFGKTKPKAPVGNPLHREKPKVTRILHVKQQRPGPSEHDHSNMQYAALGLRACHDAGIRFETALLKKVDAHWRNAQRTMPGGRVEPLQVDAPLKFQKRKGPGSTKVMVGHNVAPEGWCYTGGSKKKKKKNNDAAVAKHGGIRGSMTAGAIGALCILDYMMGKDWARDKDVLQGLQWMAKNFTVTENPGVGAKWHYYYLYGIERAGMLFGTEHFGPHAWYRTGAEYLLKEQGANGCWNNTTDTCFAILFLRRATRHLVDVATGQRR
jgi:hypothetical protein